MLIFKVCAALLFTSEGLVISILCGQAWFANVENKEDAAIVVVENDELAFFAWLKVNNGSNKAITYIFLILQSYETYLRGLEVAELKEEDMPMV